MADASFEWHLQNPRITAARNSFEPGAMIAGRLSVIPKRDLNCKSVKIRLEWHTEGRGDRDGRIVTEQEVHKGVLAGDQEISFQFEMQVPEEPWSYSGHYINILWELVAEIDLPMAINPRSVCAIRVRPSEG
ncbi:MAG: hypothetical protein JW748_03585 [Anaerolineales bacterium]|nr:hypothetical protein [Anaerolineales bacterium]